MEEIDPYLSWSSFSVRSWILSVTLSLSSSNKYLEWDFLGLLWPEGVTEPWNNNQRKIWKLKLIPILKDLNVRRKFFLRWFIISPDLASFNIRSIIMIFWSIDNFWQPEKWTRHMAHTIRLIKVNLITSFSIINIFLI